MFDLKEIVRVVLATEQIWTHSFGIKNKLKYELTLEEANMQVTDDITMQQLAITILRSREGLKWIKANQFIAG